MQVIQTEISLKRFGANGDGGYLIPDDLGSIVGNVSLGVGNDSSFELALAEKGIPSWMADASIEGPTVSHPLFHFQKTFVRSYDTQSTSLEVFVENYLPKEGDLILSMDIEGDEYDCLSDVSPETLTRFRIMIIEFHDVDLIFLKRSYIQMVKILMKLTKNHTIVHLHPNTLGPTVKYLDLEIPPVLEMTFLRNDRFNERNSVDSLPHTLDVKNASWMPEIILDKRWYGK